MKKIVWKPPRLRIGEGAEEERHATWLELFYDLLFASVVAQLTFGLSQGLSVPGVLGFAFLCVPVWWAWVGQSFYADRFDTDDLGQRLFIIAQMFAVAAMAVNVHAGLGHASAGFALSYAAVRFILVGEYLGAHVWVPVARSLTKRYGLGFGAAATIWLVSAWVPTPFRFYLWGFGLLIDFATPLTAGEKLHSRLAPHAAHLPERFASFILFVLGEAIAGVVMGLTKHAWSIQSGLTAALGLSLAFTFWWAYFDNIDGAAIRVARAKGRIWLYQGWLYAHLPLVIGLAAGAVGVQYAVASPQDLALPAGERWLSCGAAALVLLSIGCIQLIIDVSRRKIQKTRLVFRFGGAAAVLVLGALGGMSPPNLIGLLALIGGLQVIQELFL
ncbi:MAG: low temperature requirement protein A [Desulfobaccales bacterium]